MKGMIIKIGAIICLFALTLLPLAADLGESKARQVKSNEMCIDYDCVKGVTLLAVVDHGNDVKSLTISRAGKNLELFIYKEVKEPKRISFFFGGKRGFATMQRDSHLVFIFLDKHYITLHVEQSNFF